MLAPLTLRSSIKRTIGSERNRSNLLGALIRITLTMGLFQETEALIVHRRYIFAPASVLFSEDCIRDLEAPGSLIVREPNHYLWPARSIISLLKYSGCGIEGMDKAQLAQC